MNFKMSNNLEGISEEDLKTELREEFKRIIKFSDMVRLYGDGENMVEVMDEKFVDDYYLDLLNAVGNYERIAGLGKRYFPSSNFDRFCLGDNEMALEDIRRDSGVGLKHGNYVVFGRDNLWVKKIALELLV